MLLSFQDEEKAHALEAIGLLGKGPHKAQSSINVPLPSTGDDYESDASLGSEDESRPLTQNELISRIMKGVSCCCCHFCYHRAVVVDIVRFVVEVEFGDDIRDMT